MTQHYHVIPPNTIIDPAIVEALIGLLHNPQSHLEVIETPWDVAGGSTLGRVRKENQDRYLVARFFHPESSRNFFVAVVADGVGSLPDSGQSASAAIAAFVSVLVTKMEYRSNEGFISSWGELLREAMQNVNQYVYGKTAERGASTFSAVVAPANAPICAVHIGDSKIYGVSKDFHFTQLSIDQTVGSHLQSLGLPQGDLAGRDPRFERALAQYIGTTDALEPQIFTIEKKWESILIATDGISSARKALSEEGWNLISQHANSRSDFVKNILSVCNCLGGEDNSTFVVFPMSNQLNSSTTRRDASVLTAVTGSRTTVIRSRPFPIQPIVPKSSVTDRKRQKPAKFKRGSKVRTHEQGAGTAGGKSSGKSVPSVTFLPGIVDDEYKTRHPGSV